MQESKISAYSWMIREGPPGLLASRFGDISRPKDTGEKIEIQIKGKRAKEFIEKKEEKIMLDLMILLDREEILGMEEI